MCSFKGGGDLGVQGDQQERGSGLLKLRLPIHAAPPTVEFFERQAKFGTTDTKGSFFWNLKDLKDPIDPMGGSSKNLKLEPFHLRKGIRGAYGLKDGD